MNYMVSVVRSNENAGWAVVIMSDPHTVAGSCFGPDRASVAQQLQDKYHISLDFDGLPWAYYGEFDRAEIMVTPA